MKVAYWPGCVSRGFTPELHGSMAKVAPLLDIELVELDRANCCGAGVIAEHNQELADSLNARTFALAQQVEGAELMMNICSTCQGAQSECQERLDANSEYRGHVNETLAAEGLTYQKGITNKHFLWLLVEQMFIISDAPLAISSWASANVRALSVSASSWLCSAITPAPVQHARSSSTSSMSSSGATFAIEPCSSGVKPRLTQPGQ